MRRFANCSEGWQSPGTDVTAQANNSIWLIGLRFSVRLPVQLLPCFTRVCRDQAFGPLSPSIAGIRSRALFVLQEDEEYRKSAQRVTLLAVLRPNRLQNLGSSVRKGFIWLFYIDASMLSLACQLLGPCEFCCDERDFGTGASKRREIGSWLLSPVTHGAIAWR